MSRLARSAARLGAGGFDDVVQPDRYRLPRMAVTDADGTLDATLDAADFVVTVVAPDDSASTIVAVAASTQKGGLYVFDVPSAFLVAHGVGNYGVVVELDTGASRDAYSGVLSVSVQDFDTLGQLADDTATIVAGM
jgi:hypothetical protein